MSKRNKGLIVPEKFPRHTAEEFARRYQELVKETGFQIVFQPLWAMSKDTGDYRLVIQSTVQAVPH